MSPLTAVWIDSDPETIRNIAPLWRAGDHLHHFQNYSPEEIEKIGWNNIDLAVIDLHLQPVSGLDIIPSIRARKSNLPIIVVTRPTDKESCIKALNLAVNRFYEKQVQAETILECINQFRPQGFELRLNDERKAIFSQNNWIDLTSTEYKIIEALKTSSKRLTRAELQSAVWPNSSISENNLDTHLTNLKRKIPELNTVLNVKRGLGYFLDLKIQ